MVLPIDNASPNAPETRRSERLRYCAAAASAYTTTRQLRSTTILPRPLFPCCSVSTNRLTVGIKEAFINAALSTTAIESYGLSGNDDIPVTDAEEMQEHATANVELRKVAEVSFAFSLRVQFCSYPHFWSMYVIPPCRLLSVPRLIHHFGYQIYVPG